MKAVRLFGNILTHFILMNVFPFFLGTVFASVQRVKDPARLTPNLDRGYCDQKMTGKTD